MEMEITHTTAIMSMARPVVRLLEYSSASVMAQYRSRAITHRCKIDAVQKVISDESQMSQTTCPSVHVLLTVYKMLMGITRMDTSRSVRAREPIRKLAGVCSLRVRKMVAMTKALDSIVAKVTMASMIEREIWRLSRVTSSQGSKVSELLMLLERKSSAVVLYSSIMPLCCCS